MIGVDQALAMAIHREVLVEKVTRGGELPAYGIVPDRIRQGRARPSAADDDRDRRDVGLGERMEAIMAIRFNALCAAAVAATMIAISPALAGMGDGVGGGEFCKGCPSWRSPASSDPPPWWLTPSPLSVCRLVKERVGMRHGQAVYETRQVCG
jgi:hypothetical protein